jgi:hypothetical protein
MEQNWLGTAVILPDFVLPSRINQCWAYSGIDSFEHCLDKQHFKQYSHPITYNYNSRGFRDQEWPTAHDDLKNSIWCVGDSFTVGVGSPYHHVWPQQLEKYSGRQTVNISMDGASNDWILRKTLRILEEIEPVAIVLQWSYITRSELDDESLSDEERRLIVNKEDLKNTDICVFNEKLKQKILYLDSLTTPTQIIHSFIPNFDFNYDSNIFITWPKIKGHSWPKCPVTSEELENLPDFVKDELKNNFKYYHIFKQRLEFYSDIKFYIPEILQLDLARDGHHYDIKTSQTFAQQLVELVAL